MNKKVNFLIKLEAVKKRLPVGLIPLYVKAYPLKTSADLSRVKNTVAGKIQDEKILYNLEQLAESLENLKSI
tara:strand:+ start:125 stop:340 length:216 start_codon:yes stop_codon:yes gene_type:complete